MARLRKPALVALAGAVACAAASGPAVAEVFALLNPDGSYASTQMTRSADPRGSVWTSMGLAESRSLVLNPDGDRRGDGAPVLATDPSTGLPFVAWASASTTGKHDIQIATFDGHDWVLFPKIGLAGADDFDPDLAVLPSGMILVAWTHGRTNPSVWMSLHSTDLPSAGPDTGWVRPAPVAAGVRAHSPRILILRDRIEVASVGRGRPAIRFDTIALAGVTATDGPMPIPPSGSPDGPDDNKGGGASRHQPGGN